MPADDAREGGRATPARSRLRRVVRFKPLRRLLLRHVIPPVALLGIRALGASWRTRVIHRERFDRLLAGGRPIVAGFPHGRTFALLGFMSRPGNGRWLVMCSKSLDGDAMARVEERLGFEVVRGSTGTDGLQALIDMIRRMKGDPGLGACLAIDGSRGPRDVVQGGVIALAQRVGGVVLPVTAAAHPAWVHRRGWDHALVPLPFARVVIVVGEPLDVPPRLKPDELSALCRELEGRLGRARTEAEEQLRAGGGDAKAGRAARA